MSRMVGFGKFMQMASSHYLCIYAKLELGLLVLGFNYYDIRTFLLTILT